MRTRDIYSLQCNSCATELEIAAGMADLRGRIPCPVCKAPLFIEWKSARDTDGAYQSGHAAATERERRAA